jgi:hypothetical protein
MRAAELDLGENDQNFCPSTDNVFPRRHPGEGFVGFSKPPGRPRL